MTDELSNLLTEIQRGRLDLIPVLADWLDERHKPTIAERVRKIWLRWIRAVDYWTSPRGEERHRVDRTAVVGWRHEQARLDIGRMFGRRWRRCRRVQYVAIGVRVFDGRRKRKVVSQ